MELGKVDSKNIWKGVMLFQQHRGSVLPCCCVEQGYRVVFTNPCFEFWLLLHHLLLLLFSVFLSSFGFNILYLQ